MAGSSPWPIFDLRLHHGDLLLRPVTEGDLPELVAVLPDDVELDPSLPTDRTVAFFQGYWRNQSQWTAEEWALAFLVQDRNEVVGVQTLEGSHFNLLRTVDSASWLVPAARGLGIGKAMRAAVLDFAFGSLQAKAAVTSAWHDNKASLGVSRSLGYLPNGEHWHSRDDHADVMVHMSLKRSDWTTVGVEVEGFNGCREAFGV